MEEISVNVSDLPWEAPEGDIYPGGIKRKVMLQGPGGDPKAALLQLEPGFEMQAHSHVHTEHHYVIEGAYETQGRRHAAGCYRKIPAHLSHGPFTSEKGALVLVIWED